MSTGSIELGNELENKVLALIAKVNELKDANAKLESCIANLESELDIARSQAAESRRELDTCKLGLALRGSRLMSTAMSSDEAKRRINLMVREIDKCIALLKQ